MGEIEEARRMERVAGRHGMVFCGLTEGLLIRNMKRGGMLITEESDQGDHRRWLARDVRGRESREADDNV